MIILYSLGLARRTGTTLRIPDHSIFIWLHMITSSNDDLSSTESGCGIASGHASAQEVLSSRIPSHVVPTRRRDLRTRTIDIRYLRSDRHASAPEVRSRGKTRFVSAAESGGDRRPPPNTIRRVMLTLLARLLNRSGRTCPSQRSSRGRGSASEIPRVDSG